MTSLLRIFSALLAFFAMEDVFADDKVLSPVAKPVPENWQKAQDNRRQALNDHLQNYQIDYNWFAKHAFSQTSGTPYIILKLLPLIAPEYWGSKENFLDVVGLFKDERTPHYPIAAGIGLSVFNRSNPLDGQPDYATLTCAACHVGRVKGPDETFIYLDGGINFEFNIIQYKLRIFKTLAKILDGTTKTEDKIQKVTATFLKALRQAHAANPNYFYNNYKTEKLTLDAAYEKAQLEIFKERAPELIAQFITRTERDYEGLVVLLNQSYSDLEEELLAGFPGMADATGISTTNGYANVEGFFNRLLAWWFILPPTPGITDFMAVWEQDKRTVRWDDDKINLIHGGGQWNGNIPIPIYRNLAAQLTSGLSNNDIRVAAYSASLLDRLPAPVYPFNVDVSLAKKGRVLFQKNCVACHHDNNGKVYDTLGTDLSRANIVNQPIYDVGAGRLLETCSPETKIKYYGKTVQPCATFQGVSLQDRQDLIMTPPDEQLGYNALPLGGIWAQAPYLHNGSVPTLYHLLVPESRPETFVKSRLHYDRSKLGFSWELPLNERDTSSAAYIFDTSLMNALSNIGHDKDITSNGSTYKLDWSDDLDGAKALIEYLKTL